MTSGAAREVVEVVIRDRCHGRNLVSERISPKTHERRWWKRWFFIFEPRDLWVGVFVSPEKYDEDSGDFVQRTYFALIPCVVLVWQRWRSA